MSKLRSSRNVVLKRKSWNINEDLIQKKLREERQGY